MRTLIVTDTIHEAFDETGRKLSSLETVARDLSGLPVDRQVYSYEMIRYAGRTVKGLLAQLEADCRSFLTPIGQMDLHWEGK